MDYFMPTRLVIGQNAVRSSAEKIASFGAKCLIVTGASSAKRCGALDDATAALQSGQIDYKVFDKIAPNPSIDSCIEGGRTAAAFGAEFILGIGGGSAMDAAKIVALSAANTTLDAAALYSMKWANPPLPIVLIGVTAGTGSEVTPVAVITDTDGRKRSFRHEQLYASLSLGDPRYTESMPLALTASTGVDALAHCLESLFNTTANDISRAFAIQGAATLLPPLRHIAQGATPSLEARERLYSGSILGGLAIAVTGTVFPHNMGYFLTEVYGMPHGFACAVFLPHLLRHAAKAAPEQMKALCRGADTTPEELIALIQSLTPALDIALTKEEIKALLPRWENNGSVCKTVGEMSTQELEAILSELFIKY